ncbi:MAG: ATP-dependent helicase [Promethearchaeota archaeon]|nr:MAG: ATP-dependent helicase [Candidatus Lokiarchaeota archaeon]
MSLKKEDPEEEHIFEFYIDDYASDLEVETPSIAEDYNDIDFEEDLNDEQLDIVNNISGPMLVIAGAGSGKTRTIVYSVAKLLLTGVSPSQIMLVTFTNKAANEMIKRVKKLLGKRPKGIWAGTFHSIANRFLRKYARTIGLKPNYTIMDVSDSVALMKISIDSANVKEIDERFPTSKMTKDILSYTINCNKTIREVILWKYSQFDNDKIIMKLKEVFRIYKDKKAQEGLLDFDDLLVFWNLLLQEKEIAQKIAKNIKYILVDEYQDTNYIQDDIIYKIVEQNPQRNVIAVGDDAQSIYAFRGANFHNILDFYKKYKGCKTYRITKNYRSVPEILELANDSIDHNEFQHKKEMQPTRPNGLKPFHVNVGDDDAQAQFISNQILTLRKEGYEISEMAVLYRAGYHSMKIELELQAKNIPYEVRAGLAFFEKAHIKDLLVHLRVIENPYDEISWSRIFNIVQGLGATSGAKIFSIISQTKDPIATILDRDFFTVKMKGARIKNIGKKNLISHVKYLKNFSIDDNPAEIIIEIIKLITDYIKSKYEDWQDRIDDLKQLSVYAQNYPTIQNFLEILSLNISNIESKTVRMGDQATEEKPLVLSTIHRAKGLEWRVVFIPMLCEYFFPSGRIIGDPEAFEEERRVFYVAITRAKDQLYLISPAIVQTYKAPMTARLSQFISELKPGVYKKSSVQFKSKKIKKTREYKGKKPMFMSASDLLLKSVQQKPEVVEKQEREKGRYCSICGKEIADEGQIICEYCGNKV